MGLWLLADNLFGGGGPSLAVHWHLATVCPLGAMNEKARFET